MRYLFILLLIFLVMSLKLPCVADVGPAGGSITGAVVHSDGTPAAGVTVEAAPQGPTRYNSRQTCDVQADGAYSFTNLAAGLYTVRVVSQTAGPPAANNWFPPEDLDVSITARIRLSRLLLS